MKPLRYSFREVCKLLNIGATKLRELAFQQGEFTVLRDGPRDRGTRLFFPADEVEIYGTKGLEALRVYRAQKAATP